MMQARRFCTLILLALTFAMFGAAAEPPGPPTNLRCEYAKNPLAVESTAPRLSWVVNDPRRGAVQSAYQILVAGDLKTLAGDIGTVWDSGKVSSDQSVQVPYAGPALATNQRYHWKVRTWDAEDQASAYSEPAFWQMGLLSPADWEAKWITMSLPEEEEEVFPLGKWIWHPTARGDRQNVYLSHRFTIDPAKTVLTATVRMTVDNSCTLFVNGTKAGSHNQWKSVVDVDVRPLITPGENRLAVEARNEVGDSGFVCGLHIVYTDGSFLDVLSDETWKAKAEAPDGWLQNDFDDAGWSNAFALGAFGIGPWGDVRERKPATSVYLRKAFESKRKPVRATVHVSGLGLYTLWLDGQRVGEDTLTPGWTHYRKHIQYQTYDVTALIQKGSRHVLGACLGNGWWGGNMAGTWRDGEACFIAQLEVEYANGKRQRIVTDNSWCAHTSPVLSDSLYHGVTYDARLELPGWNAPGFDDSEWTATELVDRPVDVLVAQTCPPMRVTQELPALAVSVPQEGMYIFDFGQNLSGRARLKVRGPAGTRVQIRFSEILKDDGTLYTDNYRSARVTDVYVLKGDGEEVWEPEFTYRGFRYAELTGYPGVPSEDALVARVLHSAMPMAGTFKCANTLVNQIQKCIVWGQRSNLHSVPTDCPQRDERLGWTGDAQAFAPTSCWNMDMAAFYTKWMRDITDSQGKDGAARDVNPTLGTGVAAPAWGDAIKAWVEYMRRNAQDGLLYEREGYGDWVAPVESPKKPIGAAYYYYSAKLLAQMAAAAGKQAEAEEYGALAARIADAFNAAYLGEDNNYPGGTQTANILPLWFGIVPEAKREAVAVNLVKDVIQRDYHLSTGFLGTAYLMPLLTDSSWHGPACRLALQRSYPSWGYMVDNGATTIWERWNGNRIEEVGAGMNSFNHFCFGAVGQWLYESLAGIRPDAQRPGFKHVMIWPRLSEGIPWSSARYDSMYGAFRSGCRIENGVFQVDVTLPANTSATLYLGAASADRVQESGQAVSSAAGVRLTGSEQGFLVFEAGAGTYSFTFPCGTQ